MADPEIEAMMAVATALTDLEEAAQGRVLRWAVDRYGISASTSKDHWKSIDASRPDPDDQDVTEEEIASEAPAFEYLGELFAQAQPNTDPDKALVAAYWLQVVQGQNKWQAAELQRELKNLGHAISNITEALTRNMQKKPQRVIQLQKAGNGRQARKTYKVTHEGLVYVQGMLGSQGA